MAFKYHDFFVKEIELYNFRKFDYLHVTFNDQVTALTAPNGGGKSAILDALAVGCSHYVNSLNISSGITGFSVDDHRLINQRGEGMTPAIDDMRIVCKGRVGNKEMEWSRERTNKDNAKTRIANAQCLQKAAQDFLKLSAHADIEPQDDYPVAPLIVFYDTQRLSNKQRLTEKRKPQRADRFEGYGDCLTSGSYIRIFKDWYKALSAQFLQETPGSYRHSILKNQLSIVNHAVSAALSHVGWHNLKWDFIRNDLSMEHADYGTLCFSQLSDGIRNVLNLVADIVHRAVRINPLAAPDLLLNIKGLVMIDEIDMYLHPQWQQHIIGVFREIFPCVQFIVSTHSPQVLSTLKKEQIRIIGNDGGSYFASQPEYSPYAKSSINALADIFGVNPVPVVPEKIDILKVQQLYRNGQFEQAEALRQNLLARGVEFNSADIDLWKIMANK